MLLFSPCIMKWYIPLAVAHVASASADVGWVTVDDEISDEVPDVVEDGWLMVSPRHLNSSLPLASTSDRLRLWRSAIPPPGMSYEEAFDQHFDLLPENVRAVINVDIKRSGVGMSFSGKYDWLEDVLKSYALRNQKVGYCQGMNYIAAQFIAMGFSRKDAFLGLAFFIERVAVGYHSHDFPGFVNDTIIIGQLIHDGFPELDAKIAAINSDGDDIIKMIAVETSLSLFARSLPPPAIIPIWDVLIVNGRRGLLAATTGMIAFLGYCFPSVFDDEAIIRTIRCYSDGLTTISTERLHVLLGLIYAILHYPRVRHINPFAR